MRRLERYFEQDRAEDNRGRTERDRDRILYSSHLRRLTGITQVVDAGQGRTFHNRLVHTHKVEQLARRIAEKLNRDDFENCQELGGLDVSACEAAALAHDLGHPPFGHAGEQMLDELAKKAEITDGFEGNAQSFRIVTRLARRNIEFEGLNLTALTLNAILKYPRMRSGAAGPEHRKFGAYGTEEEFFNWARERAPGPFADSDSRTLEAQVMDLADDITYAVHDIEDFYRAGLVPLHRLMDESDKNQERERFIRGVRARWDRDNDPRADDMDRYQAALARVFSAGSLAGGVALTEPYEGTQQQRAALRSITSTMISRYVTVVAIDPDQVDLDRHVFMGHNAHELLDELVILKQLIWHYVITSPALSHQQEGNSAIVHALWNCWYADSGARYPKLLPAGSREELDDLRDARIPEDQETVQRGRIVLDAICSLTEAQSSAVFGRISGHDAGSVLDAIIDF